MNPDRQLEREEESLDKRLADGEISNAEYREAAQESARQAYENELDRW